VSRPAHPASSTMGTGGLSLGLKGAQGLTLATHPHLVPKSPSIDVEVARTS